MGADINYIHAKKKKKDRTLINVYDFNKLINL